MISAEDVIGIDSIRRLKESGFVVVHSQPRPSMVKAALSTGKYPEDRSAQDQYHRMVAESIRLQNIRKP